MPHCCPRPATGAGDDDLIDLRPEEEESNEVQACSGCVKSRKARMSRWIRIRIRSMSRSSSRRRSRSRIKNEKESEKL